MGIDFSYRVFLLGCTLNCEQQFYHFIQLTLYTFLINLFMAGNKFYSMEQLISREVEKKMLLEAVDSGGPELIALFGRRRVGKTFLIRQYL